MKNNKRKIFVCAILSVLLSVSAFGYTYDEVDKGLDVLTDSDAFMKSMEYLFSKQVDGNAYMFFKCRSLENFANVMDCLDKNKMFKKKIITALDEKAEFEMGLLQILEFTGASYRYNEYRDFAVMIMLVRDKKETDENKGYSMNILLYHWDIDFTEIIGYHFKPETE